MHNQSIGKIGEVISIEYLTKQGYTIIERNFKARYGEIDIIAVHKNILVFVEVKTRINNTFGTPEEAVTPRKLHEVIKTAQYYTLLHENLPQAQRIDVVGIVLDSSSMKPSYFEHTKNVTY